MADKRTIEIQAPFVRATMNPDSFNEEERTVEVVIATEEPVRRFSWRQNEEYDEVLSLDPEHVDVSRMEAGVPVYDNHWTYGGCEGVLGRVESYEIKNKQLIGVIRFADTPDVENTYQKIRQGIVTGVSVGYDIKRFNREDQGEDEIPIYRATNWMPYEVSFAPIPADIKSGVRSQEKEKTLKVEIEGLRSEEPTTNDDNDNSYELEMARYKSNINKHRSA